MSKSKPLDYFICLHSETGDKSRLFACAISSSNKLKLPYFLCSRLLHSIQIPKQSTAFASLWNVGIFPSPLDIGTINTQSDNIRTDNFKFYIEAYHKSSTKLPKIYLIDDCTKKLFKIQRAVFIFG